AGLRPVGVDLSAFAMIRALAGESYEPVEPGDYVDAPDRFAAPQEQPLAAHLQTDGSDGAPAVEAPPTRLYCNLGDVTNLAVARRRVCLFTRVSPSGVDRIAHKLAERTQPTGEHAHQPPGHVRMEQANEGTERHPGA